MKQIDLEDGQQRRTETRKAAPCPKPPTRPRIGENSKGQKRARPRPAPSNQRSPRKTSTQPNPGSSEGQNRANPRSAPGHHGRPPQPPQAQRPRRSCSKLNARKRENRQESRRGTSQPMASSYATEQAPTQTYRQAPTQQGKLLCKQIGKA